MKKVLAFVLFFVLLSPTVVYAGDSSVEVNITNGEGSVKVVNDGEEKTMDVHANEAFNYSDGNNSVKINAGDDSSAEQHFGSDDAERPKSTQNATQPSDDDSENRENMEEVHFWRRFEIKIQEIFERVKNIFRR